MHRTSSILFPDVIYETCLQYNKGYENTLIDKWTKLFSNMRDAWTTNIQCTQIIHKFFLIF